MSAKGSELKRVRQNLKKNQRNKHYKSMMKSAIKNVLNAENKESATTALPTSLSVIDKRISLLSTILNGIKFHTESI